ncbi:MAG: hypothetical protein ACRCWJ_18170 [Casimicrobium sp.]
MSLTKRILYRLSSSRPLRVIDEDGRPYLERYFLFRAFGVRCYLHRFVGDDPARGLHDHPWPWALSIILAGWYREHRRDGVRIVRWFNWLNGDRFHRVTLPITYTDCLKDALRRSRSGRTLIIGDADQHHNDNTCWSLFIHRDRATKPWGFWKQEEESKWSALGWIPKRIAHSDGNPTRLGPATWEQFTYDNPTQLGSDEWWKDSEQHPIAKLHPKRQPETLP